MKALTMMTFLFCSLSALVAQDDRPIDFEAMLKQARQRDSLERARAEAISQLPGIGFGASELKARPYLRISVVQQYEFRTEEGDVFRISPDGALSINGQVVATDERLVLLAEFLARHFRPD